MKPNAPSDLLTPVRDRWNRLSATQRLIISGVGAATLIGYVIVSTIAGPPDNAPTIVVAADLAAKLLIVLALVFLGARGLRAISGKTLHLGGARSIDVLEVTHLASNRTLYLVQIADKVILLGATQASIATLSELDDTTARSVIAKRAATAEPFRLALRRAADEERP